MEPANAMILIRVAHTLTETLNNMNLYYFSTVLRATIILVTIFSNYKVTECL